MNLIADVIQFPPQVPQTIPEASTGMYSAKFRQGYVMSSRLYRTEVRPFLTDAARNVYEKLEDWINGQLKETDHVSHRQIQDGTLKGSNKLSSATVSSGIKELIWFGVITVIEKNNKIGNKYRINEVSLAHYFEGFSALVIKALRISNESTSISEALSKLKQPALASDAEKPSSALVSSASIDSLLDSLEEEEDVCAKNKKFTAQNRPMQFVEYYTKDRLPISLKDLFKKYPAQIDFQDQAKISFPNHSHEQIFTELQKLGQWSLSASNLTPQKWMSVWLDWMRRVPTLAEVAAAAERQKQSIQKPQKPKYHQYGQEPTTSIRDVGGSHE